MTWHGGLRHKIVLILAGVVVLITSLLLITGWVVVAQGFGVLEQRQAHHRAWLGAKQLEAEQTRISELALNYAASDDMLAFVSSRSESFIESAFPPDWLSRVRLDVVAVLDRNTQVLFARSVEDERTTRTLPVGLAEHLRRDRPLTIHSDANSERTGLVTLPDGAWIISSRPIVNSVADGPVDGTFLLGRRVDATLTSRFSKALALTVQIGPPPSRGTDVGDNYQIEVNSRDSITAFVPLRDVYGEPAAWLTVLVPREIEAQRGITQYYLLGSLIVGAVVFVGAVAALLNGFIVKRVIMLAHFLRDVDATGNLKSRVADNGRDEIGSVAAAVNSLLGTIEHRNITIEHLARTDALTGLPNRRTFDEQLEQQIARVRRKRESLSIVVADIDHFKSVNDGFGHATGDRALVHTASIFASRTRAYDTAARYGGEEFAILLPATSLHEAVTIAERIRVDVEATRVTGYPRTITVSFGVAEWLPGESSDDVMGRADVALYTAKNNGRNRVEIAAPPKSSSLLSTS